MRYCKWRKERRDMVKEKKYRRDIEKERKSEEILKKKANAAEEKKLKMLKAWNENAVNNLLKTKIDCRRNFWNRNSLLTRFEKSKVTERFEKKNGRRREVTKTK